MNLNNALEWCCKIQNSMGREGVLGHGWTGLGIIVQKLQWNKTMYLYNSSKTTVKYNNVPLQPKIQHCASMTILNWTYSISLLEKFLIICQSIY